jgi:Flp pilus assembly protein TadD
MSTSQPTHAASLLWRLVAVLVSCALVAFMVGCSNAGIGRTSGADPQAEGSRCDGDLGPSGNTRLAAIQQLLQDGKPYAALAELDGLGAETPKASWLRADALRRIDRHAEAQARYTQLLNTCLAGQAFHGLGLLAAREGRLGPSIQSLTRARQLLPTDTRVRNDLGYALLLNRQWADAQFEFLTVLDLAPKDPRASRNLVLLAFLQGKQEAGQQLAQNLKVDPATVERLRQQAATSAAGAGPLPAQEPPLGWAAPIPPLTGAASEASSR